MADVDLTVQTPGATEGAAITFTAINIADDNRYVNSGKEQIVINNDTGGSVNVTLVTTKTVEGLAVTDRVIAVANGEVRIIPPRSQANYNDDDAKVQMNTDTDTLKVAVVKMP